MWDELKDPEGGGNVYNGVSLMKAIEIIKKYQKPLKEIIMELFDLKYPSKLDKTYLD